MPTILNSDRLQTLVERVSTPEEIDIVMSSFDPSSKDGPLFLQMLDLEGKNDILEVYYNTLAPD